MSVLGPPSAEPSSQSRAAPIFSERAVWREIGEGWRHLHGSMLGTGVNFEWHDFGPREEFDWGSSFHPFGLEVCLNLAGNGQVSCNGRELYFAPLTVGFYRRGERTLRASREADQRHQFLTLEMSFEFLREHFSAYVESHHPVVRDAVVGNSKRSAVGSLARLTSRHQQILASLREPPVLEAAQKLWYQTKALELAAGLFFIPPGNRELVCKRHVRLSAEGGGKGT